MNWTRVFPAAGRRRRLADADHDADEVDLYTEESFSFLAATPEAAVPLAP